MKYKVGDKVKIKENIIDNHGINLKHIEYLKGKFKFLTIEKCEKDIDNNEWYELEEDEELKYSWREDMLEKANKEYLKEADYGIDVVNEQNKIEELETKLKYKQSEIDFLKGQISVYEKFLKCKEV